MKIKGAFLKIAIGANLLPEFKNLSGVAYAGFEVVSNPTDLLGVLNARVFFSAGGQTATFNAGNGAIALSATGTRQVESATVTDAGLGFFLGTTTVTVTGTKILGSPLPINVTVKGGVLTSVLVQTIVDELNKVAAITNFYTVTADPNNKVVLTSIYGFANDATLNISWPGGNGLAALANSTNTAAGVLGVIVQRSGGNAEDIFGGGWRGGLITSLAAMVTTPGAAGGFVSMTSLAELYTGEASARVINPAYAPATQTMTSSLGSGGIVDIVAFCPAIPIA